MNMGPRLEEGVVVTIPIAARNLPCRARYRRGDSETPSTAELTRARRSADTPDRAAYDSWEESGVKSSPPVEMASRSECCSNI